MNNRRHPHLAWWTGTLLLVAAGLAIYLAVYIWRHAGWEATAKVDPRGDFSYFYTAAQAMRDGKDIYTAQPTDKARPGYIYPPLIAFLYQPLTMLRIPWAARMSLLVNLGALIVGLGMGARTMLERLGKDCRWPSVLAVAVFAALLNFDKIKGDMQMLQTNALMLLAMAAGLWLLDKRPLWTGAALGFAMNVKYQALALLVYLLFRRRWKAAGATIAWTVFWGFLPALSVGFSRECAYLVQGFSGVLRLVGFTMGAKIANIEPLDSELSISITSAAARAVTSLHVPISPFVIAGILANIWLALFAPLYRARKLPVLVWPCEHRQAVAPWRGVAGIEWVIVIAGVLAFSPQTNMRHVVLACLLNMLGLIAMLETRGKWRSIAITGLALLWVGFNLPPGNRTFHESARIFWHQQGGPSFCLLIATTLITWAALQIPRLRLQVPALPCESDQLVPVAVVG